MTFLSCSPAVPKHPAVPEHKDGLHVEMRSFGVLDDGRHIDIYRLQNRHNVSVELMTLGASIVSLKTPDKLGHSDDIVLGFTNPQAYLDNGGYYGSVIGRYANRIKGGRFRLDEQAYVLPINNGPNHLHGGPVGFDKHIWKAESHSGKGYVSVKFSTLSAAGDQGYPGNLNVSVLYRLDNENRLSVEYSAQTDAPTIVNLSQHAYFNLNGHSSGDVLDHELTIDAGFFTPIDKTSIPTGEIRAVDQTPFDFRKAKTIGQDIARDNLQLKLGKGYDHNWVLSGERGPEHAPLKAAKLYAPLSGRTLSVHTNKPGLQLYTGNFLKPVNHTKQVAVYQKRYGVCLETQLFPDSPNNLAFPQARLNPEDIYQSQTIFEFGIEK